MKAIVLEANKRLKYRDFPEPELSGDECLVKVKTAGICNSDIFRAFENGAYHYPLIMGHEFCGEAIKCSNKKHNYLMGKDVVVFPLVPCFKCDACKEGKWVYCRDYDYYGSRRNGAFAEFVAVKPWNILVLPKGCDLNLAALAEPIAVAVHTLNAVPQPESSGKLLIIGAGFIGLSLAQLARQRGRFSGICILDRNNFKLKLAKKMGFKTILQDLSKDSGNRLNGLFDVVIEASGSCGGYKNSIKLCNHQARLIWMSNIHGDLNFDKKEVSAILRKEITICGIWNSDYKSKGRSDWSQALEVISSQSWVRDLVSHRVCLKEGVRLLVDMYGAKINGGRHNFMKACITVS